MTFDEFIKDWESPSETLLVHTSGSTGAPKPMYVQKRRMLESARVTCDFLGLKKGDRALLCLPLDYIAGKMMVVRCLERGMKLIRVDASNHPLRGFVDGNQMGVNHAAAGWVGVNFAAMVPSQVFCTLQEPRERELLRRIGHLIIGGGAVSAELQAAIDAFDSPGAIWSTYGMTETLSHIALRRLNGPSASEWYTPFDGVEVSLNEDGCLVIDAPSVHEGKLLTNDIAIVKGGRFRIMGRKDNVICSGGVKLQIETIERKLSSMLRDVDFCITKREDAKFGETVVLMTSQEIDEKSLEEAFSALDRYEVPRDILLVDKIPMTETGKINRAEAARMAGGLLGCNNEY